MGLLYIEASGIVCGIGTHSYSWVLSPTVVLNAATVIQNLTTSTRFHALFYNINIYIYIFSTCLVFICHGLSNNLQYTV